MPPLASSLPAPSLMSSSESSSSDPGSSRSFPLPARPLASPWYDESMSSSVVPSLCRERLVSLDPWSPGGSGDAPALLALMQPAPAAPLAVARCPGTLSVGPLPVPFCLRRCARSPARHGPPASSQIVSTRAWARTAGPVSTGAVHLPSRMCTRFPLAPSADLRPPRVQRTCCQPYTVGHRSSGKPTNGCWMKRCSGGFPNCNCSNFASTLRWSPPTTVELCNCC